MSVHSHMRPCFKYFNEGCEGKLRKVTCLSPEAILDDQKHLINQPWRLLHPAPFPYYHFVVFIGVLGAIGFVLSL